MKLSTQDKHMLFLTLRLLSVIGLVVLNSLFSANLPTFVRGQSGSPVATITPSAANWGVFVGSSGDVHVGIDKNGIALRIEIPREFSTGVSTENDTSFIESDIRNDYYYYNVIDESKHWSYAWRGGLNSSAPCFKPSFALYDPNAPWCVEIWNYLNGTFLTFTAPKAVTLTLQAPQIAGIYNFTVFVANRTNNVGLPDFINAWNETLFVPVTMIDNPANITATIIDCKYNIPIKAKGIGYAVNNGRVVAMSRVSETTGVFTLTGLDRSIKQYDVQASAGMFKEPDGTTVAFSLTDASPQIGQVGINNVVNFCLDRAPQIWGHIEYHYSGVGGTVPQALTSHPWLTSVGYSVSCSSPAKCLNITVEALDALGTHMYRNFTISQDSSDDQFEIITGVGWSYGGVTSGGGPDPYGTEFAGLPGNAQFTVYAWVAGYNLQSPQSVTVTPPDNGPTLNTGSPSNVQLIMLTGSAISGVLKFNYCVNPCASGSQALTDEEPIQAEHRIVGSQTQLIYGGNIVIEAYDSTNTLRGITLINETRADGKVAFSNFIEVPFVIIGFSEFFNRSLTWAGAYSTANGNNPSAIPLCTQPSQGSFCWKDAALPASTYTLRVYVRGYELRPGTPAVSVVTGTLTTLSSPAIMVEGGAVRVTVSSFDNIPGTTATQSALPFRFLNLSIPVRARVYFYDSQGNALGYVERLMVTSIQNGVQTKSFQVVFAGQDWSIRDILFFGEKPNYMYGNASISAFTLGYVQQFPGEIMTPPVTLGELTQSRLDLFYANEIALTAPLFNDPSTLTSVPEHQHIAAETAGLGLGLAGAMVENLTLGLTSPLNFPIFGFGAMVLNKTFPFVGMGHFFYVPRDEIVNPRCTNYGFPLIDANHCFDYGLGKGTFQVSVPEYGFQRHFTQLNTTSPVVSFSDLFLGEGAGIFLINMAKVVQNGPVQGEACNNALPVSLSWVQVMAQASGQPIQSTTTYDGDYSLFLRGGTAYSLSFSLLTFYPQQPYPPITLPTLTWGSTTPITPVTLVPTGGPTC